MRATTHAEAVGAAAAHPRCLEQTRRAEAIAFLRYYFCDEYDAIAASAAERGLDAVIALLAGTDIGDDDLSLGFRTWRDLGGADRA